jgi:hypothetical protein
MRTAKNIGQIVILTMTILLAAMKVDADDAATPGQQLLALAGKHFINSLSPAEIKLFFNRGAVDCTPLTNHVIRADCLTWLCTDSDALKLVSDDGLQIIDARIVSNSGQTNTLDFEKAHFPVCMARCNIEAVLRLNNAHLPSLDLTGTHLTQEMDAYQVTVDHDVGLEDGFKADGPVVFYGANIGGDFDCTGGHFCTSDTNSSALAVLGTKIAGNVYLVSGFEADGEVVFRNSTVERNFDWREVAHADKAVLNLSSLKVQRFRDDEKSWPKAGNLRLDGFTYDEIIGANELMNLPKRIEWLGLQSTNTFYAQYSAPEKLDRWFRW